MLSRTPVAHRWLRTAAVVCAFVVITYHHPHAQNSSVRERWTATWATAAASRSSRDPSPAPPVQQPAAPAATPQTGAKSSMPGPVVPIEVNDQTLRQIVRTTVGGNRVRVVFTNVFGTSPLVIGGAHIALRKSEAGIVPKSGKPLLFAGERTTTIPPGAIMVSDPADIQVPPDADLAVDLYYPGNTEQSESPLTLHNRAYQTSYVSTRGNHAGMEQLPVAGTTGIWHWLARVEVTGDKAATFAIATVGDSITDGFGSTIDGNTRWPDELRRRLKANGGTSHASVLNVGIGGNQLLGQMNPGFGVNALARFDRDVLAQPGISYVVVLEGINDIGLGTQRPLPSAAALIAAQRQLIDRAHAKGLTIYGGTLTPFEGANYWTPAGEKVRQEINNWIRTSKAYDGVIDFDAAVRDPKQPTKFLPHYHAGDLLHPNSAGYKAMAAAVDLKLFERK
jgi:lysophospholipase L1-like esterase